MLLTWLGRCSVPATQEEVTLIVRSRRVLNHNLRTGMTDLTLLKAKAMVSIILCTSSTLINNLEWITSNISSIMVVLVLMLYLELSMSKKGLLAKSSTMDLKMRKATCCNSQEIQECLMSSSIHNAIALKSLYLLLMNIIKRQIIGKRSGILQPVTTITFIINHSVNTLIGQFKYRNRVMLTKECIKHKPCKFMLRRLLWDLSNTASNFLTLSEI